MNVGELIAKLAKLPPSTVVVTDDNEGFGYQEDIAVYTFQGNVVRHNGWANVRDDNGRDSVETVVLISAYGHDEMEEL